jgi:hypothetical protein
MSSGFKKINRPTQKCNQLLRKNHASGSMSRLRRCDWRQVSSQVTMHCCDPDRSTASAPQRKGIEAVQKNLHHLDDYG